jgi:hypothetical protein
MKIVPSIASVLLAATCSSTALAGPSKGEVMTYCKAEIKDTFQDISRIRTSRFRDNASGTQITFRVSQESGDAHKIVCHYKDGIVGLSDQNGEMIASGVAVNNTGT